MVWLFPGIISIPSKCGSNPFYSGVGVLGYMGPFFAESQLNEELLPVQLPFTYAHELSHLLGVSNEAEANYWAYRVCRSSKRPAVRYSAYFGLLPYVLVNASSVLTEEEFREWIKTIRPAVVKDYEYKRMYWNERYSTLLGEVQNKIYNLFSHKTVSNDITTTHTIYITLNVTLVILFNIDITSVICNSSFKT